MQSQENPVTTVKNFSFKKNDRLGKGATGAVYLGKDNVTGSRVAVKVIEMKDINNEVTKYLLNSEKNALNGLRHQNIVNCLEIVQQNKQCYIITEYCSQGTIADFMKQKGGRLPENEALNIFKGIVAGCKCFHDRGVVHRDLKPSNVLVKNGCPKIGDFGYCEIAGSTKPKMFYNVGSPAYMSPEAYIKNFYSEKSDVWALGMIYFQMLTGKPMDNGKEITNTYNMIRNGTKFVPQGLSKLSETILLECIKFDFNKRIGMKQLNELVNGGGQVNTQQETPIKSQQPQQPKPTSQNITHQQQVPKQDFTKERLSHPTLHNINKISMASNHHNKTIWNQNNAVNTPISMRSCIINNNITPKFINQTNVKQLDVFKSAKQTPGTTISKKKRGDIDALNITDPCIQRSFLENVSDRKKRPTIEVSPQIKIQSHKTDVNIKPSTMSLEGNRFYTRQPVIQFQNQQVAGSIQNFARQAPKQIPFQTIVNTPRYLHTQPEARTIYRQF